MYILLTIVILIAALLLVLIVLIQNPKGGGLSATFGGSASQYFGVQRTTDFLEKATWTLAIVILVISLGMNVFVNKGGSEKETNTDIEENMIPGMDQGLETTPLSTSPLIEDLPNEGKQPPATDQEPETDEETE